MKMFWSTYVIVFHDIVIVNINITDTVFQQLRLKLGKRSKVNNFRSLLTTLNRVIFLETVENLARA
jgi:hypothetical protein